jgi:hypothetical protein
VSVVVVIAIVANITTNYINTSDKLVANEAYNTLVDNPDDKEALATLKKYNQKLYNIVSYKEGSQTSVNDDMIYLKGLIDFQDIKDKDNINDINSILQNNNFLLKDYAIFRKALILTKQGKLKQAKDSLKFISKDSPVA